MRTRITKLFGIEHPIIQGSMHYVGFADLAAAVSNAGGPGIITALAQGSLANLAREIERSRTMADRPFGVNLTFLPAVNPPDYPGYGRTIVDAGREGPSRPRAITHRSGFRCSRRRGSR